jgi:hypothetical protein
MHIPKSRNGKFSSTVNSDRAISLYITLAEFLNLSDAVILDVNSLRWNTPPIIWVNNCSVANY